jgi:hypothetical protein
MEPRHPTGPSAQALMNAPRVAYTVTKKFVVVNRRPEMEEQRAQLPIIKEEFAVWLTHAVLSVLLIYCPDHGSHHQ